MARPKKGHTVLQMEQTAKKIEEKPIESREQKLARLADARVTSACHRIRLVGNLAAYKPSAAQVASMMEALGMACASIQNRFEGSRKESFTFTLNKSA